MIDTLQERYQYYLMKYGPDVPVELICVEYFGLSFNTVRPSLLPIATYRLTRNGRLFCCAGELARIVTKAAESANVGKL